MMKQPENKFTAVLIFFVKIILKKNVNNFIIEFIGMFMFL